MSSSASASGLPSTARIAPAAAPWSGGGHEQRRHLHLDRHDAGALPHTRGRCRGPRGGRRGRSSARHPRRRRDPARRRPRRSARTRSTSAIAGKPAGTSLAVVPSLRTAARATTRAPSRTSGCMPPHVPARIEPAGAGSAQLLEADGGSRRCRRRGTRRRSPRPGGGRRTTTYSRLRPSRRTSSRRSLMRSARAGSPTTSTRSGTSPARTARIGRNVSGATGTAGHGSQAGRTPGARKRAGPDPPRRPSIGWGRRAVAACRG